MKRETTVYAGRTWGRYPESTNRSDRVYFSTSTRRDGKSKPEYLHRFIFAEHHGQIPDGFVIHHKDGDTLNNDISNLEMLTHKQHINHHMTPERRERARQHMDNIRHLASEWHRSPEGREWHRILGKKAWENRQPITLTCQHCEIDFETIASHGNTKFCSNNCKAAARRASGVDNEMRECVFCGAQFAVSKYSITTHCSRGCSARHNAKKKKGVQNGKR